MRFFLRVLIVLPLFFSCSDKKKTQIDVSNINVDFSVKRFDVDFYNANKFSLKGVKEKYPFLFPPSFSDSLALSKINDSTEQELFIESQKIYQDFSGVKTQLGSLFKHIKYYNRKFRAPNVITLLTNIDYSNRVIYTDSLLLISVDAYLGKKHPFYSDYPSYIKENNTKDNIVVDVAKSIISTQILNNNNRSFINKIIYEGKKMYLLDLYLPLVSNKLKIGYTIDKLQWAEENEENIWQYFIEKKILYSTSTKLNKRFIEDAPFSKFYLEADQMSPGKIGVWVGWQIVNSYMQNNDVSLQEFLKIKPEDLFKKSKYKPRK
ncbi:gliding motility lipoprotein GldB [uncultured Polaribacter sp.]|uniref:gliding motility lipoprotein GldB n=1 Tax=uncultured Polaribacter sp. TaxID=174711 RepID=UPI0026276BFA|nr:gliding motility lipoprotein GldB [uncultured Polaribacter sp.]